MCRRAWWCFWIPVIPGIDSPPFSVQKQRQHCWCFLQRQLCPAFFGWGGGGCPGCPGSFMSSYTGPLLLPRGVPVSVAGGQPFNDLQGRLSQCGQVRALCITTHRSPLTTDQFPQPQPATFETLRLRPGRNAASRT